MTNLEGVFSLKLDMWSIFSRRPRILEISHDLQWIPKRKIVPKVSVRNCESEPLNIYERQQDSNP